MMPVASGEERSDGRCSASKLEGGKVWFNRYSFLKLWRRPISEVLETEKVLPTEPKRACSWYSESGIAADDEFAVAADAGRMV
jgi:hypothetical protein